MTLSQLSIILWSTSVFFVFLPQVSCGLLSDFKLCGDPKCYSQMSRVRAVRDHDGKDCRFLSFRQGESIFVHHKLTGKRSNLWSGSINQRSGYFPKEAVKEEQKIATEEIVIATQESDFLCTDNLGYPIDSSHLNADDDDDEEEVENKDSRLKSPLEDLDTSETINYSKDTNARTPSTSKDFSSESHNTSREEIENEDNGGAETKAKSPESAVELKEKGGSPASSWLTSSVTGWLGGGKQEEPDNSAEVQKKHLIPGQDLLPSSLTGWLGLTSEANSVSATKDDPNQGEQDRKAVESGWLGFGGEENVNEDDERQPDLKTESGENFRSRKMYLDFETQPIQEKKSHDVGTLGWLGNGLSQTLGFGLNDPDTSQTVQGEVEKDGKQAESASWFDLGIRNILALGEDDKVGDITDSDAKSDHRVPSDHGEDSHLDDTSQVDQKGDPSQNQRTDHNHGNEERQNNLANKDDVTSMLNAPCNDEATSPDFTKQGDNVDKGNISSDEEGKREKAIMMEQSVGQESGSSPPSKREILQESEQDDSQRNDQKTQEDHQEDIDEEELKGKRQDQLKSVTQDNVTDDNKQEEEQGSPLELVSEHLRDAQIIHQKLSEEEKGTRSSHDGDRQSSFISAFNFLKERSFVSSLGPNKEEDTSNHDKYKEVDEEEKMDQVKTIEEEETSPALIEKPEEIVQGYHKHKEEHESSEKLKISEESQCESPQEFREMEQIHEKKLPESIENQQQDDEEQSKLRKKEGVHNLMQEGENADQFEDHEQKGSKKLLEVDDESDEEEEKQETFSDLKQSVFEEQHKPKTREEMDDEKHEHLKGKEDDLEDEKQEELERGQKSEVAEVSVQKMQEEDQEEAFRERQKHHEMEKLAENKYQVGDEGGEELDKEQEQLEKLDEKKEEDGLEEKGNIAPEDIEQEFSFHLTHQTHLHEEDAQTTLVETESHEKTVNGACVEKIHDDSQRTIKELTESPSGFDGKPNDMSKTQTPQSPQHKVDSTTKSNKNLHPPSWNFPSDSLNTAEPHRPTPSETLQDHMSAEETTILAELLGQKKLEHLNDILGHADQDHDESISSDIETILHEHRERLYAPSVRLLEAPEEDKVKTRTLIAIQKLEILLKRARDTFHSRKSDLNRINSKAQTSCVGACRKDQETMKTVEMHIEDPTHKIQKQSSSPTRATDFVKWPKMKVHFGQIHF